MNPIGIAASAVVLLGLGITLRSTNGRLVVAGVALTLLALPLAAGGSPVPLVLAFRTIALLAAVFLLDHAVRRTTVLLGPARLGGTAELGLVGAAFVLGALLGASIPDPRIPAIPLGAAVALAAAAGSLLAFGTDILRVAVGAMLLIGRARPSCRPSAVRSTPPSSLPSRSPSWQRRWRHRGWHRRATIRHDLELADRPRDLRDARWDDDALRLPPGNGGRRRRRRRAS
jgi:hypothetical protein